MKTILIIERTDKIISLLLKEKLKDVTIEHSTSSNFALKRIIKNHFDLIILDANVECEDGVTICKLMRAATISGKPIIMISTFDNVWNSIVVGLNYSKNKINENIRYLLDPFSKTLKTTVENMINIKPIENNVMFNRLMEKINHNTF